MKAAAATAASPKPTGSHAPSKDSDAAPESSVSQDAETSEDRSGRPSHFIFRSSAAVSRCSMKYRNWEISELFPNFMHEIWELQCKEKLKCVLNQFELIR